MTNGNKHLILTCYITFVISRYTFCDSFQCPGVIRQTGMQEYSIVIIIQLVYETSEGLFAFAKFKGQFDLQGQGQGHQFSYLDDQFKLKCKGKFQIGQFKS